MAAFGAGTRLESVLLIVVMALVELNALYRAELGVQASHKGRKKLCYR